jgi:hypothetical protein
MVTGQFNCFTVHALYCLTAWRSDLWSWDIMWTALLGISIFVPTSVACVYFRSMFITNVVMFGKNGQNRREILQYPISSTESIRPHVGLNDKIRCISSHATVTQAWNCCSPNGICALDGSSNSSPWTQLLQREILCLCKPMLLPCSSICYIITRY